MLAEGGAVRNPAKYPQNDHVTITLVKVQAKNPAVDFRAANPSLGHLEAERKGVGRGREVVGSLGVHEPYILPIVEAAVSAHDNL